jgi:RNA polymerase sigma factor (sigma-70 family)
VPLDRDLLNQAKAAEGHLIDAEQAADIARAEFHGSVRRLQLAGGSLREIAEALGLSHQRVHQIVEAAGGSRRWRTHRSSPAEPRTCSICGAGQEQVDIGIAGPGIFICDLCIDRVRDVLDDAGKTVTTPIALIQQVPADARPERCTLCGKRRHQVAAMASTGSARICNECLRLCLEIRYEQADFRGSSPAGSVPQYSEAIQPGEAVSFTLLQEQLHSVLDTLSEREAGVVSMRFGLTDGQPKTLDEIGKVYGVTRERIRQIESKTMSKLRHPSN